MKILLIGCSEIKLTMTNDNITTTLAAVATSREMYIEEIFQVTQQLEYKEIVKCRPL
jgi:hypothetical protein